MKRTTLFFNIIFFTIGIAVIIIEIVLIIDALTENKTETSILQSDTIRKEANMPQINPDYSSLLHSGKYEIEDSIQGDFDGNGTLEYLYLFSPKFEFMDYYDNIFIFSDTNIKPLQNIEGYV